MTCKLWVKMTWGMLLEVKKIAMLGHVAREVSAMFNVGAKSPQGAHQPTYFPRGGEY